MARKLSEMLAAVGAAKGELTPTVPEVPATEGVPLSDSNNADAAPMTQAEARSLPTNPELTEREFENKTGAADTEEELTHESVFGEYEGGPTGRPKKPSRLAPFIQANAAVKPALEYTPTFLSSGIETAKATTGEGNLKKAALVQGERNANHVLDHLANGTCDDPKCKHNVTVPVAERSEVPGYSETKYLQGAGPAHDVWNSLHQAVMSWGNRSKTLPENIDIRANDLAGRADRASSMIEDMYNKGTVSKSQYNHVKGEIAKAGAVYSNKAAWAKTQGITAPLSELTTQNEAILKLQGKLEVLKAPDGSFREPMDPNTRHRELQKVANGLYGLQKRSRDNALTTVGLASPHSDEHIKALVKAAHDLSSNVRPLAIGEIPRDINPTPGIAKKDLNGNITNPEKALLPHGRIWSETAGAPIPVHQEVLDFLNKNPDNPSARKDAKRVQAMLTYMADAARAPGFTLYNSDGTKHIPKSYAVPAKPGTEAATIQARKSMTQEEKDKADIESGASLMLPAKIFRFSNDKRNDLLAGNRIPVPVTHANLAKLMRLYGHLPEEHEGKKAALAMQDAIYKRFPETKPAVTYTGPAHSFGTEYSGEDTLPIGGERVLPGAQEFMEKEAAEHVAAGTFTGVPGEGKVPPELIAALKQFNPNPRTPNVTAESDKPVISTVEPTPEVNAAQQEIINRAKKTFRKRK